MLNAIRLDFEPAVSPFGLTLRLETLALAGAILVSLVLAGLLAGRARAAAERRVEGEADAAAEETSLRRDDLILIAFGAVPGAVVGGRLGYGLIHLDYYLSDRGALLDPGKGSLDLAAAVLLGTVTALAVARLLGAPIRLWLQIAAGPLLLGLGLGKLAMALGGSGQGAYSDASWATAYVTPGLWGSLNPADPAIPSQLIEGGLVLLVLACLVVVPRLLRLRAALRPRPGLRLAPAGEWPWLTGYRRFLLALALWASVRFLVAFTWRDGRVAGPLGVEQLGLAVLIVACARVLVMPWAQAALSRRAERNAVNRAAREASRAAREVEREAREVEREAVREAKRQARLEAEREATLEAERLARLEAERKAKLDAERAERQAKIDAERAERQAKIDAERAERQAKIDAERAAREAEREAVREAKRQAKLEAEQKAKLEAERKATIEAERRAKIDAERAAREAEREAVREAKRQAKEEAERPARLEAERKAKLEAERKAKLEAERAVLQARLDAEDAVRRAMLEAAAREAAPEYPREESGSEVQVVPERAGVEPARPTRRGTHRPRGPKPPRTPPESGF